MHSVQGTTRRKTHHLYHVQRDRGTEGFYQLVSNNSMQYPRFQALRVRRLQYKIRAEGRPGSLIM